MTFRVAARTVLELGAELISSDAIAIYELVKNAFDARSPSVLVSVQIVLKRSSMDKILDGIGQGTISNCVAALKEVKKALETEEDDKNAEAFLSRLDDLNAFSEELRYPRDLDEKIDGEVDYLNERVDLLLRYPGKMHLSGRGEQAVPAGSVAHILSGLVAVALLGLPTAWTFGGSHCSQCRLS